MVNTVSGLVFVQLNSIWYINKSICNCFVTVISYLSTADA